MQYGAFDIGVVLGGNSILKVISWFGGSLSNPSGKTSTNSLTIDTLPGPSFPSLVVSKIEA